ncbi:hypothetical protein C8Q77DRAFT_326764 [Trametes polyzona]|nr:hypothetical protein C8Q77DRAFT_326764 [Trametes polyzona]
MLFVRTDIPRCLTPALALVLTVPTTCRCPPLPEVFSTAAAHAPGAHRRHIDSEHVWDAHRGGRPMSSFRFWYYERTTAFGRLCSALLPASLRTSVGRALPAHDRICHLQCVRRHRLHDPPM